MGAYGSPELPPNNNRYEYQYQAPYSPKAKKGGCLKNVLIWTGLLAVFLIVFYVVGSVIQNNYLEARNAAAKTYSDSVFSSPVISNSEAVISSSRSLISSVPVTVDDSTDFLLSWVKVAVLKCLVYPDSAKFSDNPSDWKIVRDGNICEISSIVTARGKRSKQSSPGPFVVRISYADLKADVIYISIDGHVDYDVSSSK